MKATGHAEHDDTWLLCCYKVPSTPSRARVGVWRELKRLGACYIQQAVCVLPDRPGVSDALEKVRQRVESFEGTCMIGRLTDVNAEDTQRIISGFLANAERDYAEIVEECETKFFTEIEFERHRENYTFEEAEEIHQALDKIRRWLDRVIDRDWMGAPGRSLAEKRLTECEDLFDAFENDVYERSSE